MAEPSFLGRRIRARKQEDYSEEVPDDNFEEGDSELEGSEDVSEQSTGDDCDNDATVKGANGENRNKYLNPPPHPNVALKDISFGALASAQSSIGNRRKHQRPSTSHTDPHESRSPSPFHESSERQAGKNITHASRSSKHAPTELSSKKAVTRKRGVIIAPKFTARDPRFSAASGAINQQKIERDYKFLTEYISNEVTELKARIKKENQSAKREALKRQVAAIEDKDRAKTRVKEKRDIVRAHRKAERQRVGEGKKPFFLKKREIKRQVLVKRFEDMGEKKVDKAMERRRKKITSRERKAMPTDRRAVESF